MEKDIVSFMKNVEKRDRTDYILISIFLYQIKKFIDLFKHNLMNINEKLDSKFFVCQIEIKIFYKVIIIWRFCTIFLSF